MCRGGVPGMFCESHSGNESTNDVQECMSRESQIAASVWKVKCKCPEVAD